MTEFQHAHADLQKQNTEHKKRQIEVPGFHIYSLEKNIGQGWNTYLSPWAEIDISQNMALIYYDSIVGPYFCFSSLSISYAKLSFHPHEGIYPHLIAMYKTENKEKGPINIS